MEFLFRIGLLMIGFSYAAILRIVILLFGYTYAIFLGRYFASRVVSALGSQGSYHGAATGYLEAVLVVSAWLLGIPEAIGAWLAFKVAGRWHGLKDKAEGLVPFIIGTGVSIAYGIAGALIIEWSDCWHLWNAVALAGVLPLASWIYLSWIRCAAKRYRRDALKPRINP